MNKNGNPATLVAAHPGNTNAVKNGVYSSRVHGARIAEIVAHLTAAYEFTVAQRIAVEQVARCLATLEAIDRDLDERGLTDRRGQGRSLLNHRSRVSRELHRWLAEIGPAMERQDATGKLADSGRDDYVLELKRIGLGHDTKATARDRVSALKELRVSDTGSPTHSSVSIRILTDENGERTLEYLDDSPDGSDGADVTASG